MLLEAEFCLIQIFYLNLKWVFGVILVSYISWEYSMPDWLKMLTKCTLKYDKPKFTPYMPLGTSLFSQTAMLFKK